MMRTLVFGFISLLLVGAAMGRVDEASDKLAAKERRFNEYSKNFLDFAEFSPKSDCGSERMMATDLQTVSSEAAEYVGSVHTLLTVYGQISNKEDRAAITFLLQQKFRAYYSPLIENLIKQTNLVISDTRRPGVAAEAMRMRDDLRETKDILDLIKLQ